MKGKLVRAAALAAAALVLGLLVAACGGAGGDSNGVASLDGAGSTTDAEAAAATEKRDPQEAALDWAQCMREHGVDVPDPQNGGIRLTIGPGDDREKVEQAQEECDHFIEDAAPQLTEEQQSAMQDAALAFAKCMREHGIDMPDPQFGDGGRVTFGQRADGDGSGNPPFDPDDPAFQAAQEACQPIMDEAARDAGLPGREGGSSVQSAGKDT